MGGVVQFSHLWRVVYFLACNVCFEHPGVKISLTERHQRDFCLHNQRCRGVSKQVLVILDYANLKPFSFYCFLLMIYSLEACICSWSLAKMSSWNDGKLSTEAGDKKKGRSTENDFRHIDRDQNSRIRADIYKNRV